MGGMEMLVRRLVPFASVVIVLLIAAPARAQYPPPEQPTCEVNKTVVSPGESVTVSGDNWQPNSAVEVRFRQGPAPGRPEVERRYGPFPTDSTGHFSAQITIPENAHDGPAQIVVGGPDSEGRRHICRVNVTVQEDGDGGGEPTDPDCSINDRTPTPGQTTKVTGQDWRPGSAVTVHFRQGGEERMVSDTFVNGAGRFATSAQVPHDAEPGPAQMVVRGQDRAGDPKTCVIQIEVVPAGSPAGFELAGPVTPGTLALLLGTAGVIWAARRRRTRALLTR